MNPVDYILSFKEVYPYKEMQNKKYFDTTWKKGYNGNWILVCKLMTKNNYQFTEVIDRIDKGYWMKTWISSDWTGQHILQINPIAWDYMLVGDYCKCNDVSRQYIFKIKDQFDWIHVSPNIRFIKKK